MSLFKKVSTSSPHPIENISIQRLVPKCKEWKIDTLYVTTSKKCNYCGSYNDKVYSLYGWNKKYPKIPDLLLKQKCSECGVSISASIYQPGINTPIKRK
ncbi:hypothetical protein [Anaerocolumna xylanovorans]|uniref:Uncharacterized protein n=1 Tax=Anaerocolumna xylanovorans DSM 12503 TaxID=1121345 RepID=A0A1M7Y3P5_9FIRM|nr:hypothetical protein [Anaerocolumna xylanovorans]SHO46828.1 hypothetical protein SAMN02745217_01301 [Anaerocolumna xylanovorans DSM 12503]